MKVASTLKACVEAAAGGHGDGRGLQIGGNHRIGEQLVSARRAASGGRLARCTADEEVADDGGR